jgi:hypothetical protein
MTNTAKDGAKPAASQMGGNAVSGDNSSKVSVVTVMSSAAPFQSKRL